MKYLGIIMVIGLLVVVAGGAYYLSQRFTLFFPIFSFKGWLFSFIGITVLLIGGSLFFSSSSNPLGKVIYTIGTIWLAVLLYLLLSLIFTDLLNILIKMRPIIRGIVTLTLTVLVVTYGIVNASKIRVKEVTIPIAGLTKEIKAVHITDMHLGTYWGKKHLGQMLDKVIDINPDIIFDTGDFFESKVHFTEDYELLKSFKNLKIPYYFVHGNHDEYVGIDEVVKRLKAVGVTVLQNEVAYFGELQIIGLNNMKEDENAYDMHTKSGDETIKSSLSKLLIDENRPTIALHHRPTGVSYMEEKNVDLLLSGHTHGGQQFPTTLIQELILPYNKGLYQYEDMSVYVSPGVGALLPYVRIGTNSELTLIKLVPQK